MSGGDDGVQVWRVQDGEQTATVAARDVRCLAVSRDGRWIAAGTKEGEVFVWDAETREVVFSHWDLNSKGYEYDDFNGVDFSPDSTRLVAASNHHTATVWDVATRRQVFGPLHHENLVIAAKYSPQGDRIATATFSFVRVYDNNDGHLLLDIKVDVTPWYNTGLLWSNDRLFIVSDGEIKQFEASTGSAISEWPVSDTTGKGFSCIALSQHGKFIAYSAPRTVTLWDTSTHTQLGFIQHTKSIHSIALSPDDRFLAIGGADGKITIKSLSHLTVSIVHQWITACLNNLTTALP